MNRIEKLQREHAQQLAAARVEETLAAERSEIRRSTLANIEREVALGAHAATFASAFAGADDKLLREFKVARYTGVAPDASDYFADSNGSAGSAYSRSVGGGPTAILVAPGESLPAGFEIDSDVDFSEIRQGAEDSQARANSVRAANHSSGMMPNSTIDVNAETSADGWGYRKDPRTGEDVPELRAKPLSNAELVDAALAEVPALLEGFPAEAIAEAIDAIRRHADHPDRLALVAACQTVHEGPEGEPFAWRRLVGYDPQEGYPKEQRPGDGTHVVSLKRVYQLAQKRSHARIAYGAMAPLGRAGRSPFMNPAENSEE